MISSDSMVDFAAEIQIIVKDLTQRNDCIAVMTAAIGIAEN